MSKFNFLKNKYIHILILIICMCFSFYFAYISHDIVPFFFDGIMAIMIMYGWIAYILGIFIVLYSKRYFLTLGVTVFNLLFTYLYYDITIGPLCIKCSIYGEVGILWLLFVVLHIGAMLCALLLNKFVLK